MAKKKLSNSEEAKIENTISENDDSINTKSGNETNPAPDSNNSERPKRGKTRIWKKPLKINGIPSELIQKAEPVKQSETIETKDLSHVKKNLVKSKDVAIRDAEKQSKAASEMDAGLTKTETTQNERKFDGDNKTFNKKKTFKGNKKHGTNQKPDNTDATTVNKQTALSAHTESEPASTNVNSVEATTDTAAQKNRRKKKKKNNNSHQQESGSKENRKDELLTPIKQEESKQTSKPVKSQAQTNIIVKDKQSDNRNKAQKNKPEPSKRKEIVFTVIPQVKQLNKSQTNNAFLNNFLSKVEDYLRQKAYIEPGGKLLAAVSGGVDSIVLMDCLALLAEGMRFTLYVAHFNHKLRGLSADNDEALVKNTTKEYNLHYYSGSGNVKQYSSKNSISIEHAARILRYNFFERTARNIGVDIVATAHTEDDLVETFFINLFRGSGLTGLSSMPTKRKFVKNVSLVRPFLQFTKQDLYNYASIRRLKWHEDETNSLLNYTRNKVRHELVPLLKESYNPALSNIITRTSELLQGADEVIKDLVSKSVPTILEDANNEKFRIKINMLLTFNRFMQGELIQYLWSKYFRLQPLSLSTIDRILALTKSITGSICEISGGNFVLRDRNNLVFAKRIKDVQSSIIIEKPGEYKLGKMKIEIKEVRRNEIIFNDDKNIEFIPARMLQPFVEIRNKREGDDFHPLGAPGVMKLSDFLTNEKVSLADKPNVLVMSNKFDILWVLGYRISEKCRIKDTNEKIYRIRLIS